MAGHADGKPGANGKAGADAKAQVDGKGKAPAAGMAGGGTGAAPAVPGFAPGEGVRDSAPPCTLVINQEALHRFAVWCPARGPPWVLVWVPRSAGNSRPGSAQPLPVPARMGLNHLAACL